MKTKNGTKGFSLVELMVTALAISILALTFGTTIYFVYKGWNQNLAATQLQQSAYAAMRRIAREIRHTEEYGEDGEQITVTDTQLDLPDNDLLGIPARSFSINDDGDLLFNSSELISGDLLPDPGVIFVGLDDDLDGNIDGVEVTLRLEDVDAGHTSTNRFTVNVRN
ncbi:PilW family protein [Verrucomicrobiota bacterium]